MEEGTYKKGGINPKPAMQKPEFKPPAQKISSNKMNPEYFRICKIVDDACEKHGCGRPNKTTSDKEKRIRGIIFRALQKLQDKRKI